MEQNNKDLTCWIMTEDMAGTRNQCLGVAEALGLTPIIKTIRLRQPWKALCPWLGLEQNWSFIPKLEGPWPDLLLTSGRKSIAAARYIKKQSGSKTFSVHIQDPKTAPTQFDLVALPAHDHARGENVLITQATPNRITAEKLQAAKTQFSRFEKIPGPRVAVLIGGTSKAYKMSPAIMRKLCAQLKSIQAGLMITASRRTGAENEAILQTELAGTDTYIWEGSGENPYLGLLAWADYILVTADSVSMLSEACTTGKPVYMIALEGGGTRLDALHTNLQNIGALRVFDGALENWAYEKLSDAQLVADEIKKRMQD